MLGFVSDISFLFCSGRQPRFYLGPCRPPTSTTECLGRGCRECLDPRRTSNTQRCELFSGIVLFDESRGFGFKHTRKLFGKPTVVFD
jgi:hypothetical protein